MKNIYFLGILFCLLCSLQCYADTVPVDEYKIKAAYLFNFTKFITWSEQSTETFNICILGDDPFNEAIDPIEQRLAFNRPIKLFRLTAVNKETHCHIVYVSAAVNAKSLGLTNKNILTVGEEPAFLGQGGMVAFVKQQDKVKLQINLKCLQQSGLKISAKLLEVVEIVKGDCND